MGDHGTQAVELPRLGFGKDQLFVVRNQPKVPSMDGCPEVGNATPYLCGGMQRGCGGIASQGAQVRSYELRLSYPRLGWKLRLRERAACVVFGLLPSLWMFYGAERDRVYEYGL